LLTRAEADLALLDDEIASLISQINLAFRDVLRGDGTSLHETIVLDDYGGNAEQQEARALDTDTYWWEIPDEAMHHHRFFSLTWTLRGCGIICLPG
jgi:hypothetical protein